MTVFVDTSAFLAVLNAKDRVHQTAVSTWRHLITQRELLICSNYVAVETFTLLQRRFGLSTVQKFQDDIWPLLEVDWVDEAIHQKAVTAVFAADRRRLSLVDCVSFEVMRRLSLTTAFCFDKHFAEQGFTCLPGESSNL